MAGVYKDKRVILEDLAITKPLPVQFLQGNWNPTKFGPKFGGVRTNIKSPFLQNFNPSFYDPDPLKVPTSKITTQINSLPTTCSSVPVLYRYEAETMNINNAKAYGGFDQYNSLNIPSCGERASGYMNYMDFAHPTNNLFANTETYPAVIRGAHSKYD